MNEGLWTHEQLTRMGLRANRRRFKREGLAIMQGPADTLYRHKDYPLVTIRPANRELLRDLTLFELVREFFCGRT
jgi:hypothetical protein